MEATEEQDFSKLSIEERLAHKNWKARVSAYEDLARLFPTFEDREFTKYSPLVKKFVLDTNAAAQEKGLAAVLAYIDYCPAAGKVVEPIIAGLAAKCLNSSRAKTRELAGDIVLMCIEIERQDVVVEELIKGLEQKTPKNVAAVIRMITRALNQFGSKVVAIKPIVPILATHLEHRDPTIREDTKQLCIEIYRWVKEALLPQLANLKPLVLDPLKEEFEKVKGSPKATPERLLRSAQQRVADQADGAAGGSAPEGASEGATDVPEEEIDPFELLEPVDILPQLPGDFYTALEAKKWQERKEALEKLQGLLEKNPKLVPTADYNDLVKNLKRIVDKDTNIVVATIAIKCLTMLCTGLRKGFDKHAHGCIGVVLGKFKEKKANVVQALREAIDAIYVSTSLEAIQEDLTSALDNKNPQIRSETALFMARCFAKTNPALVNKKLLKTFVTSLLKTLGDSDPTVRESSAEALGTAAKAQGDRNMGPLLQGLEALKMAKIDEYKAKVEVKKFAAVPVPAAAASAPAPATRPKPVPKRTGGARVIKPPTTTSAASSVESLVDLPEPPAAPAPKKVTTKFGAVKSRLDTGSARSTASESSQPTSGSKYATTKRPGTVGGGVSRLAKPTATSAGPIGGSSSSKKSSDDPSLPLMQPNRQMKDQRFADERSLKVLKWNFTTPREEFYHQLREQMEAAGWNASLISQAFHSDFKFHIKAIDSMSGFFGGSGKDKDPAAGANYECLVANVDLILKWIALRFFDTNPSVIMKALDLVLLMFGQLAVNGYTLTDTEANSFFPYLVNKSGDAKDVVRSKVKESLVILRGLCPPAKIFSHLFDGLQSKNARQRATCLEEIALLIDCEGMSIFGRGSAELKDIAKFVSERDNGVRNGALSCIVKVYQHEGEKVYKLIGNLNEKDTSLIEERIKRVPKIQANAGRLGSSTQLAAPSASHETTGLPTLGANRFGATMTRQPAPSQQQQYSTPESGPLEGGAGRTGTITKIGSLTNMMSRMALEGTPTGSPYDTYAKPKGAGSIAKVRSLSGLGAKSNSTLGFARRESAASSKLQFSTDAESVVNGVGSTGGGSYQESLGPRLPRYASHNQPQPMETDVESMSVVTTTSTESSDLDRRVREALEAPELDTALIDRIRCKFSQGQGGGVPGISPRAPGQSPRAAMNGLSPKSTTSSSGGSPRIPAASTPPSANLLNPELSRKFNQLFIDLSSSDTSILFAALEHLNNVTKNYDAAKYAPYLEPKVEQLIILCNKQFRLYLTKHYPESANNPAARNSADTIFRSVALLVVRVFTCPLGRQVSRDTLRELITHLLPYFLEEMKKDVNKTVFDAVNYVIQEMIKGAASTKLICALIRMLHDYVGGSSGQPDSLATFLSLTMKFMWRIVKFFDRHYEGLEVELILLECHLFFKSYPRTWWKANCRDDLPLRTIKTLVYLIVRKKGDAILNDFTLIANPGDSELSYYVQKSLRQCETAAAAKDGAGTGSGSTATANLNGSTASSAMMETPTRGLAVNGGGGLNGSADSAGDENELPVVMNGQSKLGVATPSSTSSSGYIPRVYRPDFPLPTRQLNNLTNQFVVEQQQSSSPHHASPPVVPIIRNSEDLRTLVNYTARTHNIPLNYEAIAAQAKANPSIRSVADAEAAVEKARERLAHVQALVCRVRAEQQQRPL